MKKFLSVVCLVALCGGAANADVAVSDLLEVTGDFSGRAYSTYLKIKAKENIKVNNIAFSVGDCKYLYERYKIIYYKKNDKSEYAKKVKNYLAKYPDRLEKLELGYENILLGTKDGKLGRAITIYSQGGVQKTKSEKVFDRLDDDSKALYDDTELFATEFKAGEVRKIEIKIEGWGRMVEENLNPVHTAEIHSRCADKEFKMTISTNKGDIELKEKAQRKIEEW